MKFEIEAVLKDMAEAINNAVKDDLGEIKEYGVTILKNEKKSLEELAQARLTDVIDDLVFNKELEREKKVLEAELLTIEIMTKALAQKAINAAIEVFVNAVKAALKATI